MSIVSIGDHFGCAIADITTGDCFLTELDKPQKLLDEINKFTPAEIICNDAFLLSGVDVEDLKALEEQGVKILTCGTCLNHYGLTDRLAVGEVTNMYEIAEKMTQASLIVSP